ncbi:relaxase domain-containing protein [Termitidicoccus mucosus]|uniref:AAA+ ATPase domain-containing protein n=1 Tax=Termitidicoccus mucosus TaxID=1184151 RepID=A0A178IHH3_9BACT|nr:hypothetical protein AW736_16875 [Opitutaceae bacterium TSB47]
MRFPNASDEGGFPRARSRYYSMLTPKPQLNLANAKGYFREHLATGDYYMDGHVVPGEWRGEGAALLGLDEKVTEEAFIKLCEGLSPKTGQWLTARRNTTRREGDLTVSNRRVFYDFTISPPKSVSIVALYQDDRILKLHDEAARAMADALEKFAETRVRKDGANSERVTGNTLCALFRHDTSRELDPHLHTHCIFMNATYDWDEQRWKALHATGMYRAQKFAENLYYHELARGLRELGYTLTNNARDFEIAGVPESVVERFSKRHRQIDEAAQKRIETEGLRGNEKNLRKQVAHDVRRRKIKSLSSEKLRPRWAAEMTHEERAALSCIAPGKLPIPATNEAAAAVAKKPDVGGFFAWAEKHVFERNAVSTDYELMSAALMRGRGEAFTLADLEAAVAGRDFFREAGTRKLTHRETLQAEWNLILAARDGRDACHPFNDHFTPASGLKPDQRSAVIRILRSRDFITLFQGGAGTGKSHTLREVVRGLETAGHPVRVFAPQHQQAADLRRDGLDADTVARLLAFSSHATLERGTVVVVDEAGQIGGRDMLRIVGAARECGGRVILSGDTRQQGAVAASDALRILETQAGLHPVKLDTIRRQNPDAVSSREQKRAVRGYRDAVKAAADGKLVESLEKLERLGWVREGDAETLPKEIAARYREAVERKEDVLAVARTWDAVRTLNAAIRAELKNAGILKSGVPVASWQAVDLTEAQRRDERFYVPGEGVYFLRGYGRFQRGDFCEIVAAGAGGVTLCKDGRDTAVSYNHAAACLVPVRAREIELARGDRLQMKFNGKSAEGAAIRNGELATVLRVMKDGRIRVRDDAGACKTLAASQRMFIPGYAVTTYASQGKTVDTVLLHCAGDETKPVAVNRNQWYVGISRARKQALVFTDDATALRTRIEQEGNRAPAVSLAIDETAQAGLQARLSGEHQRVIAQHYEALRATHAPSHAVQAPAQHTLSPMYQSQQPNPRKGISP